MPSNLHPIDVPRSQGGARKAGGEAWRERFRQGRSGHLWAAVLAIAVVCLASTARGREWTRFRGPNGQGISPEPTMPVKWTEEDYNWTAPLPGVGHSSPVVWGNRVFITGGDRELSRTYILAFDVSDGRELWRKEYDLSPSKLNKSNSYATGTPSVDADRVYTLLPTAETTLLVALNHDGEEVWRRDFAGVRSQHGPGNSTMTVGDLVVFSHEQRRAKQGESAPGAWIAVDAKTGKDRWRCQREAGEKVSYSTPCVYTPEGGKPQLLFTSRAHGVTGVDVETGKVVWEAKSALPARVVSSPVIAGDLVIGTCGSGSAGLRLAAIRPGASGEEVYEGKGPFAPYVPTSIVVDGLLFTYHDQGDVSCMAAATGEALWSEKPAGRFYGSPVCIDGNLYCMTREGDMVVLKASRSYELLAVNPLGEGTHATPAVADGRMYLRTFSRLICLGGAEN
jgi:outer membrane protein assembly factor BamB